MTDLVFSPQAKEFKLGHYRHYGGHEYNALYVARHTETLEEMVVYQDRNNPELVWVRPLQMFIEEVEIDGILQPRFTFIA